MKTQYPKSKYACPCCGQKCSRKFNDAIHKPAPLGFSLRQALKRQRGKPTGRNWKTDPRPHDSIAILDRAYYERANDGGSKEPTFRRVIKVSKERVFYRTEDNLPVRSSSRSTWRKLDGDLVGRAATKEEKAREVWRGGQSRLPVSVLKQCGG
jgi:hypothetical protein